MVRVMLEMCAEIMHEYSLNSSLLFRKTDGNELKIGKTTITGVKYISTDTEDVLLSAIDDEGKECTMYLEFGDFTIDTARELLHKVYDHFKDFDALSFEEYMECVKLYI